MNLKKDVRIMNRKRGRKLMVWDSRSKRAMKARPHCSKRSQYRRAWRQVGQIYQRASSEGAVRMACRDMRAPGRVGVHTPLQEVASEASLSHARLEAQ